MNSTTQYYNQNAQQFFDSTIDVEMESLYQKFLPLIRKGGKILDAGCGPGRDSKAFLDKGFQVEALDASEELVKLASKLTGLPVTHSTFLNYQADNESFDGIWACASLLHVPSNELITTVNHLAEFLKPHGVIYASFKLGTKSEIRDGKHYTDLDEETLTQLFKSTGFTLSELWTSSDKRPCTQQTWLNITGVKK